MSTRDKAAEVLAAHREDAVNPDSCLCEESVAPHEGHYAAHVADILAEAGLLRDEKAERERDKWEATAALWEQEAVDLLADRLRAEQALARVEALAEPGWHANHGYRYDDTTTAYAAGRNSVIDALRAALRAQV